MEGEVPDDVVEVTVVLSELVRGGYAVERPGRHALDYQLPNEPAIAANRAWPATGLILSIIGLIPLIAGLSLVIYGAILSLPRGGWLPVAVVALVAFFRICRILQSTLDRLSPDTDAHGVARALIDSVANALQDAINDFLQWLALAISPEPQRE